MKRALAVLLAAWLLFAAAAAEGTELEIVYFPQGGFRFGYPAALERVELTQEDYDSGLMLYAADADGNELTLMRYESRGYTLETLAASLRGDEGVTGVALNDSGSKAYVTYATETGVNVVVLGGRICLRGDAYGRRIVSGIDRGDDRRNAEASVKRIWQR